MVEVVWVYWEDRERMGGETAGYWVIVGQTGMALGCMVWGAGPYCGKMGRLRYNGRHWMSTSTAWRNLES